MSDKKNNEKIDSLEKTDENKNSLDKQYQIIYDILDYNLEHFRKVNEEHRKSFLRNMDKITENYDKNINILNDLATKSINLQKNIFNPSKYKIDNSKNNTTPFSQFNLSNMDLISNYKFMIDNYYNFYYVSNKMTSSFVENSIKLYEEIIEQFNKNLENYFKNK